MIALIPIFLNDEELWLQDKGKELLDKVLSEASAVEQIKEILILSNNSDLVKFTSSLGLSSFLLEQKEKTELSFLPAGTSEVLSYFKKNNNTSEDAIIINHRNPLISGKILDKAINEYHSNPEKILISVKKSSDHPHQLNSYYKIIDIGFLHIFDNSQSASRYLQSIEINIARDKDKFGSEEQEKVITKPFYFNWQERGIQEAQWRSLYLRRNDTMNSWYEPVGVNWQDEKLLWVYEDQNTARIIYRFNPQKEKMINSVKADFQLAGAAWSNKDFNLSLFDDCNARPLLMVNSGLNPSSGKIEIIPVRESDFRKGEKQILNFLEDGKTDFCNIETSNLCGIFYTVFKAAENDSYDFIEPFSFPESMTGKKAQNDVIKLSRDTYEPDGALCLLKYELFPRLEDEIEKGHARALILQDSNSIIIKSRFDLLKYKVLCQM
jgi:hypothetical protein